MNTPMLLESPQETTCSDPDALHYARKAEITEALVMGSPINALCGESFTPGWAGNGDASNYEAPVCQQCTLIYMGLQNGQETA